MINISIEYTIDLMGKILKETTSAFNVRIYYAVAAAERKYM